MDRRRKTEFSTGRMAALLLTLLLGATACNTAPLGLVSGDMLVDSTVGGAAIPASQPLLEISATPGDSARAVVNYVRTFETSDVEVELLNTDGEAIAVRSIAAAAEQFDDLDPGTYRLMVLEQERIVDTGAGVALAGQRMVMSDEFVVEDGVVASITCDDAGCTIS